MLKINFNKFHKKVKYWWIWLWRKDVLIFLLFVGLAFIFWWGRAMSSPRDMDIKIAIDYTGIPAKVVINEQLPTSLLVTVRDYGKQLHQLSNHELKININLSSFLQEEQGNVKLTSDLLRPRLQDILPGSTNVQHFMPEEIHFSYCTQSTKTVPIKVQASVNTAHQYQLVGEAKVTPEKVEIYGNQDIIDNIQYILTDSIIIEELRDSVAETITLITPKDIRVYPNTALVKWHAEQFTETAFTLPIQVLNQPKGEKIRLFPQNANITLQVSVSNFAEIQVNDLKVTCNYPTEETQTLPVEVHTDNPYIYNIRFSPSSVEYIIER